MSFELPKQYSISCNNRHNPVAMAYGTVGQKDGKVTEHLFCPKCYRTVPLDANLKRNITRANTIIEKEKKKKWKKFLRELNKEKKRRLKEDGSKSVKPEPKS